MTETPYHHGTGRRKCAIAQVKLMPGSGNLKINDRHFEEFFPRLEHRRQLQLPFIATDTVGKFDVTVKVIGGGVNGQAGAVKHGLARALASLDENFKPLLRKYGLLTRDPRVKERKKPGLRRARKAPQYTKR